MPACRQAAGIRRRGCPARPVECRLLVPWRHPRSARSASPPIPQPSGMTTARAAFVAIAASTAEPPARSTPSPAAVARWWGATTAPWRPRAMGAGTAAVRRSRVLHRSESSPSDVARAAASTQGGAAGRRRRLPCEAHHRSLGFVLNRSVNVPRRTKPSERCHGPPHRVAAATRARRPRLRRRAPPTRAGG